MSELMRDIPVIPESACLAIPTREEFGAMTEAEMMAWFRDDPVKVGAVQLWMRRCHDRRYGPMVLALMAAGWRPEIGHDDDMMAWAWRRPPRRRGSPGMRFASTDQAFRALGREKVIP